MSSNPSALVLAGHGLNCERETAHAFAIAGANTKIIHIDDLASNPSELNNHQILAIPGGFSYGDHTGAGLALASTLSQCLNDPLRNFFSRQTLTLGICNGCQALIKSALWTENHRVAQSTSIAPNQTGQYICRWETLKTSPQSSPWLTGLSVLRLPIAHGEGRFVTCEDSRLPVALTYTANPNGSAQNAAALIGYDGRTLVMMPHPERALRFTQQPDWTFMRECLRRKGNLIPDHADGVLLFRNAVNWFK